MQDCGHVCSISNCHHPPVPSVRAFQPPPAPTSEGIPSARSHKKLLVDDTPAAQQVNHIDSTLLSQVVQWCKSG